MTKIVPPAKQLLISGQSGAVAIMTAIMMFLLLGFAAFAVDFGYSYVVKNELQNTADAAALAGASVLFSDNPNCLASGSPFACCTGLGTGSCVQGIIDDNNVTLTAEALVGLNIADDKISITNVDIGHYAFASTWDAPGIFSTAASYTQMTGWHTMPFSVLNGRTDYINSVKVTVTRSDVPRFFSRIWSTSDLGITAQATAYIGFAGTLLPDEVDQPIAICKQKIINDDEKTYTCSVGRMMNQNTQTSYWTDFDQANCGTADVNKIGDVTEKCSKNGTPIIFGTGMSTTNATATTVLKDILECWKNGLYDSNNDGELDSPIDTDNNDIPDKPWRITLPVVDCPPPDNDNCRTVVGAVVVNVVWITDEGNDEKPTDKKISENSGMPSTMSNPLPGGTDWNKSEHPECAVSDLDCWNKFVDEFNLEGGTAEWKPSSLYFLPDCQVHSPTGSTGGENFGIQARYPVLVK